MIFNEHSDLKGLHAFLGASKYHWLNYDDAKLISSFRGQYAQVLGTTLHEIAANLIQYNMKLAKNDKKIIRFELEKAGVPSYAYVDRVEKNALVIGSHSTSTDSTNSTTIHYQIIEFW